MATYCKNSCSFGLRYVLWYKYLIVNLVFSHLGFWIGNLFLIAPFPDRCLLVPLYVGAIIESDARSHFLYSILCKINLAIFHARYVFDHVRAILDISLI